MTTALYSIADYGATLAAATAGINAAALAAYTAGGGTVYIPPGTWTITTTAGYALHCYPGVSFAGAGKGLSILKVADAQPDYAAIFGHEPGQPLTHFSLRDLTLDYNSANNPITTDPIAAHKGRVALLGSGANDVTVERCSFLHAVAVNVIELCAVSGNVRLLDNDFEETGLNDNPWDHSTVYVNEGPDIIITGNRFVGVSGGKMARTAIETHGDRQVVTGNTILNYCKGMNICGSGTPSSEGLIIAHNNLMNVRTGIALWAFYYGSNTSDPALCNVQIAHNNITLDTDAWASVISGEYTTGICFINANAQTENVQIVSNNIRLKPFAYAGQAIDNLYAGGITAYQAPASRPALTNRNWKIADNLIDGSHSSGILLGLKVDGLEVSRNTVVNPAQLPTCIQDAQKTGVWLDGTEVTDLVADANIVRDTRATPIVTSGMRIDGLLSGRVFDTYLSVVSGSVPELVANGNLQVR